jgi:hypothetical protein
MEDVFWPMKDVGLAGNITVRIVEILRDFNPHPSHIIHPTSSMILLSITYPSIISTSFEKALINYL